MPWVRSVLWRRYYQSNEEQERLMYYPLIHNIITGCTKYSQILKQNSDMLYILGLKLSDLNFGPN